MDEDDDVRALAVRDAARAPDAYEAKYMGDGAVALYRAKSRAGWGHHAMHAGLAVFTASTMAVVPLAGALTLTFVGAMWLGLLVSRVTVTDRALEVQLGPFGPTIPLHAITQVEARDYTKWRTGIGVRMYKGGWLYNFFGDGGRLVHVEWTDEKGRRRVTGIGTPDADAIVRAVQRGRGG